MNPANAVTLLRIVLIGPIVFTILRYDAQYTAGEIWRYAAFSLYLVAALTDLIDGHLARRYKCITRFGSVLDPTTDKILCITAILVIASSRHFGPVPEWYPSVMIAKDIVTAASSLVVWKRNSLGSIHPLALGKLSTFAQNVTICWLLLIWPRTTIVLIISGAINVLAAVAYLYVWLRPSFGKKDNLNMAADTEL